MKVILTGQGGSCDINIEGVVKNLRNVLTEVYVATSDLAEQQLVFSKGAQRISAMELYKDIKRSKKALESESRRFRDQRQRGTWSDDQLEVLREIYKDMLE